MYLTNTVCFRYVIVSILYKGDNKDNTKIRIRMLMMKGKESSSTINATYMRPQCVGVRPKQ